MVWYVGLNVSACGTPKVPRHFQVIKLEKPDTEEDTVLVHLEKVTDKFHKVSISKIF